MRFLDLEPEFVKRDDERLSHIVMTMEEADGVQFLCPTCFKKNAGPIGTHSIICYKPHVPLTVIPGPGRWAMQGKDLNDITLVGATSSSVHLTGPGCGAHFHVTKGEVISCNAGETL